MSTIVISSFFFFFNDTATTEIYTLSLHDALPIWEIVFGFTSAGNAGNGGIASLADFDSLRVEADVSESQRSEEHTSELQSLAYLVCRLLLEKKKKTHL